MPSIVVLITAPGEDDAVKISRTLVEERLAACVNIVTGVRSVFSWEGKVEDEPEVLMIVKTQEELFERLSERVKELHPYSVPEVIALPISQGLKEYMDWMGDVTG